MNHRGTDPKNKSPYREYLLGGCIAVIAFLAIIPIYIRWENQISAKAGSLSPADSTAEEYSGTQDFSAADSSEPVSSEDDSAAVDIPATETEGSAPTDPSVTSEPVDTESDPYDFSRPVPESDPVDIDYFDDAVIIGNSRAEGLILFNELSNTTAFTHNGLTVSTVFTTPLVDVDGERISAVDALRQTEFTKVYLMFGINEVGWESDDIFIQRYQKLIDEIKSINPEADIYVHSIFPVSAKVNSNSEFLRNKKIRRYNKRIQAMAEENRLYYLDAGERMFNRKDGCLPDNVSTDGIHLKVAYYKQWMDYLLRHTVGQKEGAANPDEL
ncbi:MAG: hypothetical protein J1D89_07195 [Agathobacter sp.]|nr:hypothetical protein [Agathobacter sp.]